MNKQIILAAVAGSVAAADPVVVPCSDAFVSASEAKIKALDAEIKTAEGLKTGLEAATKKTLTPYTNA